MGANKHMREVNQNLQSLKTYKKEVRQNKHVKEKAKQTDKKLRFLGNSITHARTGLRVHHQACVRRQDYAYANPCPKNAKIGV